MFRDDIGQKIQMYENNTKNDGLPVDRYMWSDSDLLHRRGAIGAIISTKVQFDAILVCTAIITHLAEIGAPNTGPRLQPGVQIPENVTHKTKF